MIKELRVAQWTSFDHATLYIDPLTIVIGTNASGKSNLLDALSFLQRIASGAGVFQAINGDVALPSLRGGMEWACRKPAQDFELEALIGVSDLQEYRFRIKVQVNGSKADLIGEELTLLTYRPRGEAPREQRLYHTRPEESGSPGIGVYFQTGTQGPGKRFDLSRSYSILTQLETTTLRKEIKEGARKVVEDLQQIFVFDPIPNHMRGYTISTLAILGAPAHRASRDRQSRGQSPHGGPWGTTEPTRQARCAAPARRRGTPRDAAQAVAASCASTRSQAGREITT